MKRVYIASPLRQDPERMRVYAARCLRDSLDRGEAPFAPHLLYPQALDDTDENERKAGMDAGLAFLAVCDFMAVYIDHGISGGMRVEIAEAQKLGKLVERRMFNGPGQPGLP